MKIKTNKNIFVFAILAMIVLLSGIGVTNIFGRTNNQVFAVSGTSGEATWTLENGELRIMGEGSIYDFSIPSQYLSSVTSIVVCDGIEGLESVEGLVFTNVNKITFGEDWIDVYYSFFINTNSTLDAYFLGDTFVFEIPAEQSTFCFLDRVEFGTDPETGDSTAACYRLTISQLNAHVKQEAYDSYEYPESIDGTIEKLAECSDLEHYWTVGYVGGLAVDTNLSGAGDTSSNPTPSPSPTPATGVVTDIVMPAILVLVTGFVAMAFVFKNKKSTNK